MGMGIFSSMISRKFRNIAGERYDEIMRFYREFLLSEDEMRVSKVSSVLLPLDSNSTRVPGQVCELLSVYAPLSVHLIYVIDEEVIGIIERTLGKEEAELFRERELEDAARVLKSAEEMLAGIDVSVKVGVVLGDKKEEVISKAHSYDMLVVSKRYGSSGSRTSRLSPVVLAIVHGMKKPVVVY